MLCFVLETDLESFLWHLSPVDNVFGASFAGDSDVLDDAYPLGLRWRLPCCV